ncbi:hypothetical protein [Desulfovibrio inopinatus]|uniref:hypothetical protein n=1 Tax=Desulfovibrio inopinatus TaxID=102109 RepID=UPI0004130B38|nr:hypothetical protein [Desulfovibrio inopinatus]
MRRILLSLVVSLLTIFTAISATAQPWSAAQILYANYSRAVWTNYYQTLWDPGRPGHGYIGWSNPYFYNRPFYSSPFVYSPYAPYWYSNGFYNGYWTGFLRPNRPPFPPPGYYGNTSSNIYRAAASPRPYAPPVTATNTVHRPVTNPPVYNRYRAATHTQNTRAAVASNPAWRQRTRSISPSGYTSPRDTSAALVNTPRAAPASAAYNRYRAVTQVNARRATISPSAYGQRFRQAPSSAFRTSHSVSGTRPSFTPPRSSGRIVPRAFQAPSRNFSRTGFQAGPRSRSGFRSRPMRPIGIRR